MADYRFLATSLLDGTVREELPFRSIEWSHVRNGAGQFFASIDMRHAKATRNNLDPGRTLIVVERDGIVVGDGVLWGAQPDGDTGMLQLSGASIWSVLRRHPGLDESRTYSSVDQLDIARDLVKWMQGTGSLTYGSSACDSNGDLNIAVDATASGVARDRSWDGFEFAQPARLVEQLADVRNGFDFDVVLAWSGGSIGRTFTTWYPRRGRRTELVLEAGVNVEAWSYGVDAGSQEIVVHGVGRGEGADMLTSTATDASKLGVWPLVGSTISHKDVKEQATLDGHVQARLDARANPVTSPRLLQVRIGPQLPYGSWVTGDEVRFRVSDGWAQLDTLFRIQGWSTTVDAGGDERVQMTLVETETLP